MPNEIERRFLVDPSKLPELGQPKEILQFYLSLDPERTVRARFVNDEEAFLTIKGAKKGATCPEFEYSIPLEDAREMVKICKGHPVSKERYLIDVEGHQWEVDKFLELNDGLWIAEIELESEDEPFVMPEWAVREITHDGRYANASLSRLPYTQWQQRDPDYQYENRCG